MKTIVCNNLNDFLAVQELWDGLWEASDVCNPSARSGSVIAAVEQLYNPNDILTVMLLDNGRAVAAILLVKQYVKKLISVFATPNNEWGRWGELMIDPDYDRPEIYAALVDELEGATTLGIRLNDIDKTLPRWSRFVSAMKDRYRETSESFAFHVGIIEHDCGWDSYCSRLSSGFKKKLRKYNRGLNGLGQVSFEQHSRFNDSSLEHLVAAAFAVENRSWKSEQGSSIVASGKSDFYSEQARHLANKGHLRISFLRLNDEIIAFEFGSLAKGTYNSWKISFDAAYAKFAPGQILTQFVTRSFHEQRNCRVQDTVGPLSQATEKWITDQTSLFNVMISGTSITAILGFKLLKVAKTVKRLFHPAPNRCNLNSSIGRLLPPSAALIYALC